MTCRYTQALRKAATVEHYEECPAYEADETACDCSQGVAAVGMEATTCEDREAVVRQIVENYSGSPECCCGYLQDLYDSILDADVEAFELAQDCSCYGGALVLALVEGCSPCGRPAKEMTTDDR